LLHVIICDRIPLGLRKKKYLVVTVVAAVLVVTSGIVYWQYGQPRRTASQTLCKLASVLTNPNGSDLLDAILMPVAVRDRTPAEQQEFIAKALRDEISPEGVLALKHHAEFGPAKSVFPVEIANWCKQSGVNADDCVAFKMERAGIRAEVVLVREGKTYRVVRGNNVKQMAEKL